MFFPEASSHADQSFQRVPELHEIVHDFLRYIPSEVILYGSLLTDVDDTLTNHQRQITAMTTNAVNSFQAEGGRLATCTGRHFATLRTHIMPLFKPRQLHIVCGGAQIIDSGGNIYWEKSMPGEVVAELVGTAPKMGCGFGFGLGDKYYGDLVMQNRMSSRQPDVILGDLDEVTLTKQKIPLLVISRLTDPMRVVLEQFADNNVLEWKEMTSQDGKPYADVTAPDVEKRTGIAEWANLTGAETDKVIRVGDSLNDESMLIDGIGIAMGNAHPDIKKIARFILPSSKENGLAVLLNLLTNLKIALS